MKIIYIIIGIGLLAGIIFFLYSRKNNSQISSQISSQNRPEIENKTKIAADKPDSNIYPNLRAEALNATAERLDLTLPNDKTIVYGVVMDWDLDGGTASLVAFQTGDASIYFSYGGGIIGGGFHENVKKAALAFIDKSQNYLSKAAPADATPLPGANGVKFYFLTNKGKFAAQEKLENFENRSSRWLELFEEANKVITELRLISGEEYK
jgi:hypothetical protein